MTLNSLPKQISSVGRVKLLPFSSPFPPWLIVTSTSAILAHNCGLFTKLNLFTCLPSLSLPNCHYNFAESVLLLLPPPYNCRRLESPTLVLVLCEEVGAEAVMPITIVSHYRPRVFKEETLPYQFLLDGHMNAYDDKGLF
ncbi:hypothetical protein VULLAG_LOCUS9439 [Vulpes lagopus]